MNDEQLSAAEHDVLRSRLLAGTKRIKPAGAHRRAIITTTVAVVIVAGLSAGAVGAASFLRAEPAPVATNTPLPSRTSTPTPTSTSTPTATSTPTPPAPASSEAIVPFGGDCDATVDAASVRRILGSEPQPADASPALSLFTARGVTALSGGLVCDWSSSSDGLGESIQISIFPSSVVVPEVMTKWTQLRAEGMGYYYEKHRRYGDLVIGATATPLGMTGYEEPSEEDLASVDQRIEELIAIVARNAEFESAQPALRDASWWSLGTCADLSGVLASEVAEPLTVGFPGDHIPLGMTWDTLVGAKAVDWCSWYGGTDGSSVIVELYPMPGVGRPEPSDIAVSSASPGDVAGADESWITEDSLSPGSFSVVAVSGSNRLALRFSGAGSAAEAESLAAAFLAQLG